MSIGRSVEIGIQRLVAPVEGMHKSISGRWFSLVGPVGRPAQVVHDTIAGLVYSSIRAGAVAVGAGLDASTDSESRGALAVQAFTNGMWGDALGRHEQRLAIPMTVRDSDGAVVAVDSLSDAYGTATGRLVVMVHGLVETELCWEGSANGEGLAQAIAAHPELTPVAVRYNTGLRVSDNGAQLAALLEQLHDEWPVPVESLALVGHSMGGLVARSACLAATEKGHRWIRDLTHVVALGSPHRGAPLEKLVNALAWGLQLAPATRPLAEFLNGRSSGIKDLRFGAVHEDDWRGIDPDALLRDTVGDHELPAGVAHQFVTSVITADPAHPVGVIAGDLMVRPTSGTGGRLRPTNATVIGGLHHFDLLHDPAVIDTVMAWLIRE